MGQLKAKNQIVSSPKSLSMGVEERLSQLSEAGFVGLIDDELMGICASIGPHGHGLPAKDQFRAALAKAFPTTRYVICNPAGSGSVPSFHWLNGKAVANLFAINPDMLDRLRERRRRTAQDIALARQFNSEQSNGAGACDCGFESRHAD